MEVLEVLWTLRLLLSLSSICIKQAAPKYELGCGL
jgi:hypothetical protein